MHRARKLLLTCVVWLTATSVLVAALPQRQCVCANGMVHVIPLALSHSETGCCSAKGCCSARMSRSPNNSHAPAVVKTKSSCCDAHGKTARRVAPAKSDGAKSQTCTRDAAQPKNLMPPSSPTKADKDSSVRHQPAVIAQLRATPKAGSNTVHGVPACLHGPPRDLTVFLQHFTI